MSDLKCGQIKKLRGKGGIKVALPTVNHKPIIYFEKTGRFGLEFSGRYERWKDWLCEMPGDMIIPLERKLPDEIKIKEKEFALMRP